MSIDTEAAQGFSAGFFENLGCSPEEARFFEESWARQSTSQQPTDSLGRVGDKWPSHRGQQAEVRRAEAIEPVES